MDQWRGVKVTNDKLKCLLMIAMNVFIRLHIDLCRGLPWSLGLGLGSFASGRADRAGKILKSILKLTGISTEM